MSKDDVSVFSPVVEGITEPFNVGGGSNPVVSSIFPDRQQELMPSPGAQAYQMVDNDAIAGVGATSGAVPFVQLASGVETSYSPDPNDPMLEGLGLPPRP